MSLVPALDAFSRRVRVNVPGGADAAYIRGPRRARFLRTPDPYLGSIGLGNPQSFNRYAYVTNSPLAFTDATGLGPCDFDCLEKYELAHQNDDVAIRFNFSTCGTIEGVPASCSLFNNLLYSGATYIATGLQPQSYTAKNGRTYDLAWGADGQYAWFYKGNDLGSDDVAELGLPQIQQSFADYIKTFPWTYSAYIPIPRLAFMAGATITLTKLPKQGYCVGVSATVSTPAAKGLSAGPLLHGNLNNSKNIISGWGWNFSLQAFQFAGYQVVANSSGVLGGPTVATDPGISVSYGKTWCKD